MNVELLTLCDFVNLDSDAKLNIVGARYRFLSDSAPFRYDNLYVASRICIEDQDEGDKVIEFGFIGPDGRPAMQPNAWQVRFRCEPGLASGLLPLAIALGTVEFLEFGAYDLMLKVGGEIRAKARIHADHWNFRPPV